MSSTRVAVLPPWDNGGVVTSSLNSGPCYPDYSEYYYQDNQINNPYAHLDETQVSLPPSQQLDSPPLYPETTRPSMMPTYSMALFNASGLHTDITEATSELASSPPSDDYPDALMDAEFDRVEREMFQNSKQTPKHTGQGSGWKWRFGSVPPSVAFKVIETSERINEKFVADAVDRSQRSARKVNKRRPLLTHRAA